MLPVLLLSNVRHTTFTKLAVDIITNIFKLSSKRFFKMKYKIAQICL